jgi:hypothetical protein
MMTLAALLLVGCRSQTSIEKAISLMDDSKNMRFELEATVGSEKRKITICRARPNRFHFSSPNFDSYVNEKEGFLELNHSEQLYASKAWFGQFFAGLDVFTPIEARSSTVFGIAKLGAMGDKKKWKSNGKKEGLDEWQIDFESPKGVVSLILRVDSDGKIKYCKSPDEIVYRTISDDYNASFKDSEFAHNIPDGYSTNSTDTESSKFMVGDRFSVEGLSRAKDVENWKPSGFTLFCLINPEESNNLRVEPWISIKKEGYSVVPIFQGSSTKGFSDTKNITADWCTSTPYFVLVGEKMNILGIWAGFDPNGTEAFEKDIRQVILDR